ncbi:MAG TPA: T9SS type A sorting domain-containing protein [Chitinophagales bacterium]|nr:T9SS type A sorting domain-containing protein [Chitinophagales bacterium]
MKPHFIITGIALLLLTANSLMVTAQNPVEYLSANNVLAPICIGGNLFYSNDTSVHVSAIYQVPKGSNIPSVFTSALWLTATDANGNLRCAAQRYCYNGHDFFDGPINSNAIYDNAYDAFFKRVFKVTRNQIEQYKADFLINGTNLNIADVDPAIRYWPARGNSHITTTYGVSINSRLAPFIDTDGDGNYNPVKGDYPGICGDEAIFFVFNDVRAIHGETGGMPLSVEVRGLAEVYVDSLSAGGNTTVFEKRAINNTTFVKYEIENKSLNPLTDIKVGLFYDMDLGCYSNDGIACDTSRNLIFAYNRVAYDADCQGVTGYRNIKAATGVVLLNGRYSSAGGFVNGALEGYNDPVSPAEFYYYNNGLWANGEPYIRGDGDTTVFVNCGQITDPDVHVTIPTGTGLSGDKRMVGVTAGDNLMPGQIKMLDYAFFASYDSTATNFTIVDTLRRDADVVQSFYNNTIVPCRAAIGTGITKTDDRLLQVSVYPNPASSQLVIETPGAITRLQLTNMLGQVVLALPGNSTKQVIDVSGLAKGIYLLNVKAGSKEAVLKVVIE